MAARSPYDLTAEGREALRRLDRDAASAAFAQALEEQPDFVDAVVGLGQVAYERGDVGEAERRFAEAIRLCQAQLGGRWPARLRFADPRERSFLRAIHGAGIVAYRQGRTQDALRWFTLEQRLDPQDHQGSRYLVRNINAGKRWQETAG